MRRRNSPWFTNYAAFSSILFLQKWHHLEMQVCWQLKRAVFCEEIPFYIKNFQAWKNLRWIYNSFKFIFQPSLVGNIFFKAIYMQIFIWGKERLSEVNRQATPPALQYTLLKAKGLLSATTVERWTSSNGFVVGPVALFPRCCIREETGGHVVLSVRWAVEHLYICTDSQAKFG